MQKMQKVPFCMTLIKEEAFYFLIAFYGLPAI